MSQELTPVTVNGKLYLFSKIQRKATYEHMRVTADNVRYFGTRDGERFGPTRVGSENSRPGTIGRAVFEAAEAAEAAAATEATVPDTAGREVDEIRLGCKQCAAAGVSSNLRLVACNDLRDGEPDGAFCRTHGYVYDLAAECQNRCGEMTTNTYCSVACKTVANFDRAAAGADAFAASTDLENTYY